MVPRVLSLRNFMSYGDERVTLDFEGMRLICLSGGNGNGKSALLDAITWVLWGESRARREDDLVYQGAKEMEVELEFAVGGGCYRVLRKRTLRPSGGTTALEFHALGEGGYTPVTGGTMRETQARIIEVLRLRYEGFVNSTFLRQGHADEFTVKPAGERKAVLAEILGLEEYERLSERARLRGRDLARTAEVKREGIAESEERLTHRPQLHQELAELEEKGQASRAAVDAAKDELRLVGEDRVRLEGEQRRLDAVQRTVDALDREIATLARRRDEAARAVAAADELLAEQARILAGVAELGRVREELDEMGRREGQMHRLEKVAASIEHEVKLVETTLRNEMHAHMVEAERAARLAKEAPALRRQVEEYGASEARIAASEEERATLAEAIEEQRRAIAELQGENACLEADMKPLRERLKLLQEKGAACPICGQPMAEPERQRIYKQFTEQGVAKREALKVNMTRLAERNARIKELQERDKALAATLAGLHKQARELGGVRQRLEQAEEAAQTEQAARTQVEIARQALQNDDYAHEQRAALLVARQDVERAGYSAEAHQQLRRRASELIALERQASELVTAGERRRGALETMKATDEDLSRRRHELDEARAEAGALRAVLAGKPALEAREAACRAALQDRQRDDDLLRDRISTVAGRLRELDALEESLREKRAELGEVERESDAFAELGRMFGKAGIQAMIIDNALPELERGANAILGRMSDSGMQVQFSTQKQSVKGDLMETLDITIADANGTRPYEMFSGGEAFRVNFAIRIALSRLLAERAGTRLQMLVIDEGFGTQDSQGRERLVEAIASIAEDFEKIILITHIDELKDLFSTRIEVVKGLGGSRLSITAA